MTQTSRKLKKLSPKFGVSSERKKHSNKSRNKRPPPLSIRLSEEERIKLEKEANGMPLGTYVKREVFGAKSVPRKRTLIHDYELLAQVLSALGQTEVFANLDKVARAVEAGEIKMSQEQEEQIMVACTLVLEIRNSIVTALGVKAD